MGLLIVGVEHACVVCDARLKVYVSAERVEDSEMINARVEGSEVVRCPGCKRKRPFKAVLEE